jgi:hypothetical protein
MIFRKIGAIGFLFLMCGSCTHGAPTEPSEPSEEALSEEDRARYERDAARLAVREMLAQGDRSARIDPELKEEFFQTLVAVHDARKISERDTIVDFEIHTGSPDMLLFEIWLEGETPPAWTAAWREGNTLTGDPLVDARTGEFGLRLDRYFEYNHIPIGPIVWFAADEFLNLIGLGDLFRELPGVARAGPLSSSSRAGHEIHARRDGDAWILDYILNYSASWVGEWPAPEHGRRAWTFRVTSDEEVTYLGTWEWNNYEDLPGLPTW